MRTIILIAIILISWAGLCDAQLDQECFDRCIAQSAFKTDANSAYCTQKCSGNQVEYPKMQLEVLKQQLEIQKESLEVQKQQLELQKELQEKLLQQQTKEPTPEPAPEEEAK